MRRRHLFELEDQPWFPGRVRDYATDYLHFVETRFELHRAGIPVLAGSARDWLDAHRGSLLGRRRIDSGNARRLSRLPASTWVRR